MPNHNHQRCINQALQLAADICHKRDLRFTSIRRKTLELVWSSHCAIKAYDILNLLSETGQKTQPPTVYRALDFLVKQGFVHKVESQNAFIGCPHPERRHNCQLLICEKCGTIEELCNEDITSRLTEAAEKHHFQIKNITLELKGICKRCGKHSIFKNDCTS